MFLLRYQSRFSLTNVCVIITFFFFFLLLEFSMHKHSKQQGISAFSASGKNNKYAER